MHRCYQGKYHLKPIVGHWIKIEISRKAAVQSQMILFTFCQLTRVVDDVLDVGFKLATEEG